MTTVTVNAYLYYPSPTSPPILVERMGEWVCECGNEGWQPISHYPGRFMRLEPVDTIPDVQVHADAPHCHQ